MAAGSLSQQLTEHRDKFGQSNSLNKRIGKSKRSASLLWTAEKAASLSTDHVYGAALECASVLAKTDGHFQDVLTHLISLGASRSLKTRAFLSAKEAAEIDQFVNTTLTALGERWISLEGLSIIEFFIRAYEAHAFHFETLFILALPFYQSPFFVRLCQVLDIPRDNSLVFLNRLDETGITLSERSLIQRIKTVPSLFTLMVDRTVDIISRSPDHSRPYRIFLDQFGVSVLSQLNHSTFSREVFVRSALKSIATCLRSSDAVLANTGLKMMTVFFCQARYAAIVVDKITTEVLILLKNPDLPSDVVVATLATMAKSQIQPITALFKSRNDQDSDRDWSILMYTLPEACGTCFFSEENIKLILQFGLLKFCKVLLDSLQENNARGCAALRETSEMHLLRWLLFGLAFSSMENKIDDHLLSFVEFTVGFRFPQHHGRTACLEVMIEALLEIVSFCANEKNLPGECFNILSSSVSRIFAASPAAVLSCMMKGRYRQKAPSLSGWLIEHVKDFDASIMSDEILKLFSSQLVEKIDQRILRSELVIAALIKAKSNVVVDIFIQDFNQLEISDIAQTLIPTGAHVWQYICEDVKISLLFSLCSRVIDACCGTELNLALKFIEDAAESTSLSDILTQIVRSEVPSSCGVLNGALELAAGCTGNLVERMPLEVLLFLTVWLDFKPCASSAEEKILEPSTLQSIVHRLSTESEGLSNSPLLSIAFLDKFGWETFIHNSQASLILLLGSSSVKRLLSVNSPAMKGVKSSLATALWSRATAEQVATAFVLRIDSPVEADAAHDDQLFAGALFSMLTSGAEDIAPTCLNILRCLNGKLSRLVWNMLQIPLILLAKPTESEILMKSLIGLKTSKTALNKLNVAAFSCFNSSQSIEVFQDGENPVSPILRTQSPTDVVSLFVQPSSSLFKCCFGALASMSEKYQQAIATTLAPYPRSSLRILEHLAALIARNENLDGLFFSEVCVLTTRFSENIDFTLLTYLESRKITLESLLPALSAIVGQAERLDSHHPILGVLQAMLELTVKCMNAVTAALPPEEDHMLIWDASNSKAIFDVLVRVALVAGRSTDHKSVAISAHHWAGSGSGHSVMGKIDISVLVGLVTSTTDENLNEALKFVNDWHSSYQNDLIPANALVAIVSEVILSKELWEKVSLSGETTLSLYVHVVLVLLQAARASCANDESLQMHFAKLVVDRERERFTLRIQQIFETLISNRRTPDIWHFLGVVFRLINDESISKELFENEVASRIGELLAFEDGLLDKATIASLSLNAPVILGGLQGEKDDRNLSRWNSFVSLLVSKLQGWIFFYTLPKTCCKYVSQLNQELRGGSEQSSVVVMLSSPDKVTKKKSEADIALAMAWTETRTRLGAFVKMIQSLTALPTGRSRLELMVHLALVRQWVTLKMATAHEETNDKVRRRLIDQNNFTDALKASLLGSKSPALIINDMLLLATKGVTAESALETITQSLKLYCVSTVQMEESAFKDGVLGVTLVIAKSVWMETGIPKSISFEREIGSSSTSEAISLFSALCLSWISVKTILTNHTRRDRSKTCLSSLDSTLDIIGGAVSPISIGLILHEAAADGHMDTRLGVLRWINFKFASVMLINPTDYIFCGSHPQTKQSFYSQLIKDKYSSAEMQSFFTRLSGMISDLNASNTDEYELAQAIATFGTLVAANCKDLGLIINYWLPCVMLFLEAKPNSQMSTTIALLCLTLSQDCLLPAIPSLAGSLTTSLQIAKKAASSYKVTLWEETLAIALGLRSSLLEACPEALAILIWDPQLKACIRNSDDELKSFCTPSMLWSKVVRQLDEDRAYEKRSIKIKRQIGRRLVHRIALAADSNRQVAVALSGLSIMEAYAFSIRSICQGIPAKNLIGLFSSELRLLLKQTHNESKISEQLLHSLHGLAFTIAGLEPDDMIGVLDALAAMIGMLIGFFAGFAENASEQVIWNDIYGGNVLEAHPAIFSSTDSLSLKNDIEPNETFNIPSRLRQNSVYTMEVCACSLSQVELAIDALLQAVLRKSPSKKIAGILNQFAHASRCGLVSLLAEPLNTQTDEDPSIKRLFAARMFVLSYRNVAVKWGAIGIISSFKQVENDLISVLKLCVAKAKSVRLAKVSRSDVSSPIKKSKGTTAYLSHDDLVFWFELGSPCLLTLAECAKALHEASSDITELSPESYTVSNELMDTLIATFDLLAFVPRVPVMTSYIGVFDDENHPSAEITRTWLLSVRLAIVHVLGLALQETGLLSFMYSKVLERLHQENHCSVKASIARVLYQCWATYGVAMLPVLSETLKVFVEMIDHPDGEINGIAKAWILCIERATGESLAGRLAF